MTTSIREYARHRKARGLPGGTPKAVRAARDSGRLQRSIASNGQIADVALADHEWAEGTYADRVPLTGPTAPSATRAPSSSSPTAPASAGPMLHDRARDVWIAVSDLLRERDVLELLATALAAECYRASASRAAVVERMADRLREFADPHGADEEGVRRAAVLLAHHLDLIELFESEGLDDDATRTR